MKSKSNELNLKANQLIDENKLLKEQVQNQSAEIITLNKQLIFTNQTLKEKEVGIDVIKNEQMQKLLRLLHEVLLTCKKSDEASAVSELDFFYYLAYYFWPLKLSSYDVEQSFSF